MRESDVVRSAYERADAARAEADRLLSDLVALSGRNASARALNLHPQTVAARARKGGELDGFEAPIDEALLDDEVRAESVEKHYKGARKVASKEDMAHFLGRRPSVLFGLKALGEPLVPWDLATTDWLVVDGEVLPVVQRPDAGLVVAHLDGSLELVDRARILSNDAIDLIRNVKAFRR